MNSASTKQLLARCRTYLHSNSMQKKKTAAYLIGKMAYPDKGSGFDRSIGVGKYIFRTPILNRLILSAAAWYFPKKGYDALLLELDDCIIGHAGFQVHQDNSLHIFSIEMHADHTGMGLARFMVERLLEAARQKGIHAMRIGGGRNEATNRIHANFSERETELGIAAKEGNWLEIR